MRPCSCSRRDTCLVDVFHDLVLVLFFFNVFGEQVCIPDLGESVSADDHDVFFYLCMLAELFGAEETSARIELDLVRVTEDETARFGVFVSRDVFKPCAELVPFGLGVELDAFVLGAGDVELADEMVALRRGHEHSALVIHGMIEFT